jgi:hypoxanthine phosphoribosyltransferase
MDHLHRYLSEKDISALNDSLAKRISQDYSSILTPSEELLVIVTLKGAAFFAADLMRRITVPLRMDFVRLASYGSGSQSSGSVQVLKDVEKPPTGQHVLVLDEIVDSGRTLAFLFDRLKKSNPKSLKLCALLSKPSRREVPVEVHYLGKEVDDKFLVGYGLDYAERYRNLSEIYTLDNLT